MELDFTRVKNPGARRRLNQMPTSLGLNAEQVAQLRAAAHTTLHSSEEWNAFLASVAAEASSAVE